MNELAKIKHYFASDQFDIEEVLSILEMEQQVDGHTLGADFRRFLCEVISACTPPPPGEEREAAAQRGILVDKRWRGYGSFVVGLCRAAVGLAPTGPDPNRKVHSQLPFEGTNVRYDVISLNYDLVLERTVDALGRSYSSRNSDPPLRFLRTKESLLSVLDGADRPALAKLHGCVSDQAIVPPTWRKQVTEDIQAQWKAAGHLLAEANEIRILGYSLPAADSYVRYLLKAAAANARNLRSIDMITLDWDGSARRRFEDFVVFTFRRFVSANVKDYFVHVETARRQCSPPGMPNLTENSMFWHDLEAAHQTFIEAKYSS
jgi:hypothetical protein